MFNAMLIPFASSISVLAPFEDNHVFNARLNFSTDIDGHGVRKGTFDENIIG